MASEKEWVVSLTDRLRAGLKTLSSDGMEVRVETGHRLSYRNEVLSYPAAYPAEGNPETLAAEYETDLLISDVRSDGSWVPRVVIECKTGAVTTHDALTYSSKAATHKHVHPYLRYGILIGDFGETLPARLVRHGAYFDFMMVWAVGEGTSREWEVLIALLREEVAGSRSLQQLLTDRTWGKKKYRLLHRPLRFQESGE